MGCLQPAGNWLASSGKDIKKEVNGLLDRIGSIDGDLMRSREHVIGVLLAYVDLHQSDFIEFVRGI